MVGYFSGSLFITSGSIAIHQIPQDARTQFRIVGDLKNLFVNPYGLKQVFFAFFDFAITSLMTITNIKIMPLKIGRSEKVNIFSERRRLLVL